MKRLLDISVSLFILFTFPVHILLIKPKSLRNAATVLTGRKTWISYCHPKNWLPDLQPGILTTTGSPVKFPHPSSRETANLIDHWYAKNYDWTQDLKIIIKNYKRLGGRS
jgi:lipopolysaccharide/colanic/teichoic acid biosynthesis glycosyltransferase